MSFVMQIDEQILLLFEGAMGFHCNREKKKKMPYMCFKKNIELNLNSFSTPSESDPYPQPLERSLWVQCAFALTSLCLRSNFAPEGGQKATPKGLHSEASSTPKPACQSETDRYALQCNSSDLTTTTSGKRQKKCQLKTGEDIVAHLRNWVPRRDFTLYPTEIITSRL